MHACITDLKSQRFMLCSFGKDRQPRHSFVQRVWYITTASADTKWQRWTCINIPACRIRRNEWRPGAYNNATVCHGHAVREHACMHDVSCTRPITFQLKACCLISREQDQGNFEELEATCSQPAQCSMSFGGNGVH
jgi:hypothetical protein